MIFKHRADAEAAVHVAAGYEARMANTARKAAHAIHAASDAAGTAAAAGADADQAAESIQAAANHAGDNPEGARLAVRADLARAVARLAYKAAADATATRDSARLLKARAEQAAAKSRNLTASGRAIEIVQEAAGQ